MTKKNRTEMVSKEFRVMLKSTRIGDSTYPTPVLIMRESNESMTRMQVEAKMQGMAKKFDADIKAGRMASYEMWMEAVTNYDIAFMGKREMPEAQPDSLIWLNPKGKLVDGDILRFRVSNPALNEYGQYAYAVCTGGGFGCDAESMGSAIFVRWVGYDFNEVMSHRKEAECPPERSERWERRWKELGVLKE